MPKDKKEEVKAEEPKDEVKATPINGQLRPIEWASQKAISNVAIAGAFIGDNEVMSESEFDEKLKAFMEKPANV